MTNVAIHVERLSKRYRIGKLRNKDSSRRRMVRTLSASFQYLASTLRPPSADEIIWALKDVSFDVNHGEVIGIIGQNGAGKSTLLKVLSRITEPTTGRAIIHGRVGSLLEVGTGFHPELTGRENIYLSGTILGMKRNEIDRKLDDIVAFAGVEKFLDTQVKRYSSGMYVRLGFAVAAHLDPEILLIDEVLAVGDAAFQKKCLGKMDDIATEGRTVLFVSHNMVAVQNLCKRSIWLDQGEKREEGESSEVISKYLSFAAEDMTRRVWPNEEDAPGNDKVRVHALSISPMNGESGDQITMEKPVVIKVKLWNQIPEARMLVGCRFHTERQEIAFTTISNESQDGFDGEVLERGLHRWICHIPGNLLNEGGYRITLFVYQDRGMVIYRMDDALTFNVVNVGKRPGYRYSREPGVVRPLFKWKSDFLHDI